MHCCCLFPQRSPNQGPAVPLFGKSQLKQTSVVSSILFQFRPYPESQSIAKSRLSVLPSHCAQIGILSHSPHPVTLLNEPVDALETLKVLRAVFPRRTRYRRGHALVAFVVRI